MSYEEQTKAYIHFFEHLHKELRYEQYEKIFHEKVYFEDPFQQKYNLKELVAIFEHMYASLQEPKFEVHEYALTKNIAFLHWRFSYKLQNSPHSFKGVSRVEFDATGKAISHIDFWDSASNVYEKVPLLGAVLRLCKQKLQP